MKRITAFFCMASLVFGCANSSVNFTAADGSPVSVEQRFGGRGCIAVSRPVDGSVDIIIQQDGSSDWSGVRAIPALVQIALATLFGNRGSEDAGFAGPSDIQGCAGLFVDPVEEEE